MNFLGWQWGPPVHEVYQRWPEEICLFRQLEALVPSWDRVLWGKHMLPRKFRDLHQVGIWLVFACAWLTCNIFRVESYISWIQDTIRDWSTWSSDILTIYRLQIGLAYTWKRYKNVCEMLLLVDRWSQRPGVFLQINSIFINILCAGMLLVHQRLTGFDLICSQYVDLSCFSPTTVA